MNKINVKELSAKIRENIKENLKEFADKDKPTLAVIQVGHDSASDIYVRNKRKACEEVGIKFNLLDFDVNITTSELLCKIDELNKNDSINGILVQLPLPKHIDENILIESINPLKDVDGFSPNQSAKIYLNNKHNRLEPCTAKGIVKIIENITDIEGKNITVVGRSNIVGKPVANLLTEKNATVTLCHSKTQDLEHYTQNADIIILAVGIPKYFGTRYFYNGFLNNKIIIDAGINRDKDGKLCGDLNVEMVEQLLYNKNISYTPVPGGVGIMTVTELLENVCEAFYLQKGFY